jgi:hypothetical protein
MRLCCNILIACCCLMFMLVSCNSERAETLRMVKKMVQLGIVWKNP